MRIAKQISDPAVLASAFALHLVRVRRELGSEQKQCPNEDYCTEDKVRRHDSHCFRPEICRVLAGGLQGINLLMRQFDA